MAFSTLDLLSFNTIYLTISKRQVLLGTGNNIKTEMTAKNKKADKECSKIDR